MFIKTRWRLTFYHSAVLLGIIILLGSGTYLYTKGEVFRSIDESILRQEERIKVRLNVSASVPVTSMINPGIQILMWDERGRLLTPLPEGHFFKEHESELVPVILHQLYDQTVGDYALRILAFKVDRGVDTVTIQLIRNVDAERKMLDTLLLILWTGIGCGAVISLVGGLFLADRALIPIRNAWERQQQFVADASHELRTPLSVIRARIESLLRHADSRIEDRAEDVVSALNETRRLERLVSDMLTLARTDANGLEIEQQPVDIKGLLEELTSHYAELASLEGKSLILHPIPDVTVTGDRARLHQLLVILLDNAIKYTGGDGRIEVGLERMGERIQLEVADNGIGIPEGERNRVFDRFYRGDQARTRETGGAGLGLPIAKWIVEQHGGTIEARPRIPRGTRMIVTMRVNR